MKNFRSACLVILLVLACGRIAAADPEPREPLTPVQIEELVSPIALYPDPLVALILPATTRPSDIVLAARFLARGGDPERAALEPWDESVKALARYREVLAYLDENLAWTRRVGECFLDQPDEMMDAIQMVRVRARAAGLLTDTSEQEVIVEGDEIRIVPASPTVIYVPRYDPEILYVSSLPVYYPGPFLTFGAGYRVGAWLSYDCDWRYRTVRIAHRPDHWYRQPDWRGRHPTDAATWNRWVPPPRQDRRFDRPSRSSELVVHPSRPRGLPGPAPYVAPSTRHRDAGRPDAEQSPFHPSATRDAPIASQTPGYQRPPAHVPPQRAYDSSAANPRQDRGSQPSVRSAQADPPPTPRVIAPPSGRPQPTVQARPAEPRNEDRDRPSNRPGAEKNERRFQQN